MTLKIFEYPNRLMQPECSYDVAVEIHLHVLWKTIKNKFTFENLRTIQFPSGFFSNIILNQCTKIFLYFLKFIFKRTESS